MLLGLLLQLLEEANVYQSSLPTLIFLAISGIFGTEPRSSEARPTIQAQPLVKDVKDESLEVSEVK